MCQNKSNRISKGTFNVNDDRPQRMGNVVNEICEKKLTLYYHLLQMLAAWKFMIFTPYLLLAWINPTIAVIATVYDCSNLTTNGLLDIQDSEYCNRKDDYQTIYSTVRFCGSLRE